MEDSTGWLLNVYGVGDVQQAEMHTTETLVLLCSAFGVDTATENMKKHKSPGINQIQSELFVRGSVTVCCGMQKCECSVWKDREVLW